MILKAIVGFFKVVISAVAKAIAWLLIALGLWLPAIYAVVFFLVCAATKTNFSSIKTLFYLGLVLTTAFSVWHTLSTGRNKKLNKKKQSAGSSYVSKVTRREDKVELRSNTPPNGSIFRPDQKEEPYRDYRENDYRDMRNDGYRRDKAEPYRENDVRNDGSKREDDRGDVMDDAPMRRDYNSLKKEYYSEMKERYGDDDRRDEPQDLRSDFLPYNSENSGYKRQESSGEQRPKDGSFRRYYNRERDYQRDRNERPKEQKGFEPYRSERTNYDDRYEGGRDNYRYRREEDSLRQREVDFQPYHKHSQNDYGDDEQNYEYGRGYRDRPSNRYGFEPYTRADEDNAPSREFENSQQEENVSPKQRKENPRIFLSRRDSSLIIYEYSDRLELFKKTAEGLVHHGTKYKH